MLDSSMHHLGDTVIKEWTDAPKKPESKRLDLHFQSAANTQEWTLSLKQRDVDEAWHVEINDKRLFDLKKRKEAQVRYYPLPPGTLRTGDNVLSLVPHDPKDDIAVGVFYLW